MSGASGNDTSRPWSLAVLFIATGLLAFGLSLPGTTSGLTNRHDPGPWLLPRLLAVTLVLGGVLLVVTTRQRKDPAADTKSAKADGPASTSEPTASVPMDEDRWSGWKWQLLGGSALYVIALPWAGFMAASVVFILLLLRRLEVNWWRALVAAVVLAVVAQGIFGWLFKVPLPAGAWN
jgi:hypothetical protein